MRHPVVFKHFGQETKTRLVDLKKNITDDKYDMWTFFRIVDTLKCVYS